MGIYQFDIWFVNESDHPETMWRTKVLTIANSFDEADKTIRETYTRAKKIEFNNGGTCVALR